MRLYPRGDNVQKENVLTLFLELEDAATPLSTSYSIRIIDSKTHNEISEFLEKKFRKGELSRGKVVDIDKLGEITSGGTLRVSCLLRVILTNYLINNHFDMARRLSDIAKEPKYSDFVVKAETNFFKVHKKILAKHSIVFDTMFRSKMREDRESKMEIHDHNASTVARMIKFLYTSEISEGIGYDELLELLSIAEMYKIESLKKTCRKKLLENIECSTAMKALIAFDSYNDSKMKKKVLQFIAKNLTEIVTRNDFYKLKKSNPQLLESIIVCIVERSEWVFDKK
ncbi:hypothetical protein QAD02_017708 [Eretmocerus hayati]|uniref:Uncharacterized protein n=1 Tax=Eretmocerus hayati TaxID=131215 RepID=A0ACC2PFW2_9HYME|nr:hypothetical protein QAD02_017708 [Eretmocerus hayati]